VTTTRTIFPEKYADFGMGEDASLRIMPVSRSMATLMARPLKATLMMPQAMMPATKYCLKSVCVPGTVPVKIEPRTSSSTRGSSRVKNSDCRFRKNDFSSTDDRAADARHIPEPRTANAPAGRSRSATAAAGLTISRLLGSHG